MILRPIRCKLPYNEFDRVLNSWDRLIGVGLEMSMFIKTEGNTFRTELLMPGYYNILCSHKDKTLTIHNVSRN